MIEILIRRLMTTCAVIFLAMFLVVCFVNRPASAHVVKASAIDKANVRLTAQTQDESDTPAAAKRYADELAAVNPILRLRAAENLARLAAVNQKLLVEGYRLQEKDKRVRLALDWALYRFGVEDKLFPIVAELNSTARRSQAISYLSQLDSPEPLYNFLNQPKRDVVLGILDALVQVGDAETLAKIKSLERSIDKRIAERATRNAELIGKRLTDEREDAGQATRPRRTGIKSEDEAPIEDN